MSCFPKPEFASVWEYPAGDGAITYLCASAGEVGEKAYLKTLADNGYTVFDHSEIPGSSFTTLRGNGMTVIVNRFGEELRVTADPFTAPYKLSDPCERTAQTTVWMHEVDHTLIDCGMCFIIRCCDGSFFIIDSGHFFQMNDNDRIHRFMRERTPKGQRIRIAGWFLSHAHSDHICKFSDFLRFNMDDCDLEAVYYNFPEVCPPEGAGWGKHGDCMLVETVGKQLAALTDLPKVKLHSGQRFAVRNLNFTVLCTHEDIVPTESSDFNDTTTVLMMEAEGSKVLFCGDASDMESKRMVSQYGDLLRCDVVQVAHHGHHGCSAEFYELSQGKAAMFSNTQIFHELDMEKEKEANGTVKKYAAESYVSSNGTVEFDLPYHGCKQLPDETFEDFFFINRLWGYKYTPERKAELYEKYLANHTEDHYTFYADPNAKNWHSI